MGSTHKEFGMKKLLTGKSAKTNLRRLTRILDKAFAERNARYHAYAPLVTEVSGAYGADVGQALEEVFKSLCHFIDAHTTLQEKLDAHALIVEYAPAERALRRSQKRLVRAHKALVKIRGIHKR